MLANLLLALDQRRSSSAAPELPHPYLEGNYAPVGRESDFAGLAPSRGRIPDDLRGTLYRVGPAPRFPPLHRSLYHWFDGDGMIDAFYFAGGRIHHKNRWVRTAKFQLEERAGRALFGGLRDFDESPYAGLLALGFSPIEIAGMRLRHRLGLPLSAAQYLRLSTVRNTSNTNVQYMAGRLLSLAEGSVAYEIDPDTLATRGAFDFGGVTDPLKGGMSAHPKIDPRTGDVYTLGYWFERGGFTYYVFDRQGALKLRRDFVMPYASIMHDLSITESNVVFYHLPAVIHLEDARNPIRWEPSRGARIGVLPRHDPSGNIRWYDIPSCFIFHQLNAYDDGDGDSVVLDVVKYPRLPLFDGGGENLNPWFGEFPPAKLVRLRLHLPTGGLREELLSELSCEFPSIDPRYAGRRYRHGFIAAESGATCRRGAFNALLHVDLQTGQIRRRVLGPSSYTSEPLFAPRGKDGGECDGYLIATVHHAERGTSEVLVLDAQHIDDEPVAVIPTPQRVPFGFHGTFLPIDSTA